jgi:predicted glycosyltransferase
MNTQPTLLLYCQHSLGMGHLIRSFSLAGEFSKHFRVVFLNGGPVPEGINIPGGIEMINLPPLGMDLDNNLVSRDSSRSVETAMQIRKDMIMKVYRQVRPSVFVIELFPFARKKFTFELMPILEQIKKNTGEKPLVLCSLRDILVTGRDNQQKHDDRACKIVNEYFDGVFVHTDPDLAKLEESFTPQKPLTVPVFYTGFVLPNRKPLKLQRKCQRIVVSAGGGIVGELLFYTALAAHEILWRERQIPMTIIAGPFLPEQSWQRLQILSENKSGLSLQQSVPDLAVEIADSAVSISQCGYNTAMDLLYAKVPALVVPFSEGKEDEQLNRARRLAALGLVQMLHQNQLTAENMVKKIQQLLYSSPEHNQLDLGGAEHSAYLIREMVFHKETGGESYGLMVNTG